MSSIRGWRLWRLLLAGIFAVALIFSFLGLAAAESALDQQSKEIAAALNCPVCGGISVAESTAPMAEQMRALIRKKLEEGEKREAVLRYFVDRYGEGILREPIHRGVGPVSWWIAAGVLIVGGAGLTYFVSGWWLRRAAGPVASGRSSQKQTQGEKRSNEVQVWRKDRARKRRK